jgi:hypothetical protein
MKLRALLLSSLALSALTPCLLSAEAADGLPSPLSWVSTGPLVSPIPDAAHPIVSVKDPTVVRADGMWHVIATTSNTKGQWSMIQLNFATWAEAGQAEPYYLDQNPNLTGYHCAPQVFFFRPHNKWYLIYQSQHPTFSTTDDIGRPETWTAPEAFFEGTPKSVVEGWIDYWVICDDTHAYLFFSDDHGRFYRSRTTIADFPKGFDEPVVIMQEPRAYDLFEASCIYRLKDSGKYLCIIECLGGEQGGATSRPSSPTALMGNGRRWKGHVRGRRPSQAPQT